MSELEHFELREDLEWDMGFITEPNPVESDPVEPELVKPDLFEPDPEEEIKIEEEYLYSIGGKLYLSRNRLVNTETNVEYTEIHMFDQFLSLCEEFRYYGALPFEFEKLREINFFGTESFIKHFAPDLRARCVAFDKLYPQKYDRNSPSASLDQLKFRGILFMQTENVSRTYLRCEKKLGFINLRDVRLCGNKQLIKRAFDCIRECFANLYESRIIVSDNKNHDGIFAIIERGTFQSNISPNELLYHILQELFII